MKTLPRLGDGQEQLVKGSPGNPQPRCAEREQLGSRLLVSWPTQESGLQEAEMEGIWAE